MRFFKVLTIYIYTLCFSFANTINYSYNLDNQLVGISSTNNITSTPTLSYDNNGNLISDNLGNHYSYNLENQLINYSDNSGNKSVYTYYPNRMRGTKTVNTSSPVSFYYNGDQYAQIVNEATDNTNFTSYAMLGQNRYVRIVHQNNNGNITNTLQYLIKDNKNIIAKLGSTGKINNDYAYNPYGTQIDLGSQTKQKHINNQKSNDSFNILSNPFGYESEYKDSESGLIYLRARYYSPELMRFISRDTTDLSNRYSYADGNPISNVDPGGHMAGWLAGLKMFATASASALAGVAMTASGVGYYFGNGMEVSAGYQLDSAIGYFGKKNISSSNFRSNLLSSFAAGYTGLAVELGASQLVKSGVRFGLSKFSDIGAKTYNKIAKISALGIGESAAAPFYDKKLYSGNIQDAFSGKTEENYLTGVWFAEGIAKPALGKKLFNIEPNKNEPWLGVNDERKEFGKLFRSNKDPDSINSNAIKVLNSRLVYTSRTVGQYTVGDISGKNDQEFNTSDISSSYGQSWLTSTMAFTTENITFFAF